MKLSWYMLVRIEMGVEGDVVGVIMKLGRGVLVVLMGIGNGMLWV